MEQLVREAEELAEKGAERADPCCTGDHLYGKDFTVRRNFRAFKTSGARVRYPVDPPPVLLPGGDHR